MMLAGPDLTDLTDLTDLIDLVCQVSISHTILVLVVTRQAIRQALCSLMRARLSTMMRLRYGIGPVH